MFSIAHTIESGFEKISLKSMSNKTYATILPACGAILHEFMVENHGVNLNVIDSYTSLDDFKKNAETKGFLGAKLSPFVCRLENGAYTFKNKKYTFENFYLGKHAIHGSIYKKPFTLTGESANENFAEAAMKYEYRADDIGYPFHYDCAVTWKLENDNQLTVITECINKSEYDIPVQDGWHPYFQLSDPVNELELRFESKEMVEFDEDLLPTKNLIPYKEFRSLRKIEGISLDNCFTLNMDITGPKCILRNPAKKIEIELFPGKSYPFLQIYIPPHRKSIAIENLSGAPNGFNNGIGVEIVKANSSVKFSTTYKVGLL
jgi:aldose 1-epimerase